MPIGVLIGNMIKLVYKENLITKLLACIVNKNSS